MCHACVAFSSLFLVSLFFNFLVSVDGLGKGYTEFGSIIRLKIEKCIEVCGWFD